MGLDIIIPVIVVAVLVPTAFIWAKKNLKDGAALDISDDVVPPSDRLTSNALRELSSPPWHVVYEIAPDKLGGVGHVLIGPPGVFAMRTTMDSLPAEPIPEAAASAIAEAAITRGGVDDALRRCSMSSDQLVIVHWGINETGETDVGLMPGVIGVDGRALATWAAKAGAEVLSPAQVDLAWQTIVTSIGRPDPLA